MFEKAEQTMTSSLSPAAIHRILCFMESGDRGKNAGRTPVAPRGRYLWRVSPKWARIYRLFFEQPAPPLGYLQSLGLALSLKDALDDEDLRAIFEHTKPLEVQQYYWQQQPIVPAVVEVRVSFPQENASRRIRTDKSNEQEGHDGFR